MLSYSSRAWVCARLIVAAFVASALAGCASSGQTGPAAAAAVANLGAPPASRARVVVVRERALYGAAMSFSLKIDNEAFTELTNGAYGSRDIAPGRHLITAEVWGNVGTSRHEFQAVAGRTYYVLVKANEEKARVNVASSTLYAFGVIPGLIATSVALAATEDGTGPLTFVPMTAAEAQKALQE
jgi:uncharacterized protein DUF2846